MNDEIPLDADGDAIRRVLSMGMDLSRPVSVDFFVAVPDRQAGESVLPLAARAGYRGRLIYDSDDDSWTCYCSKTMLLNHADIIVAQNELDELSRPYGAATDGWGTAGESTEGDLD